MHSEEPIVEIVPFRDAFAKDFQRLSRNWLERYVRVEPLDRKYMDHPRETIVEAGGEVFFAVQGDVVVGTCAAIVREAGVVELAKLGVDPSAQRRGLGRRLSERVIEFARGSGASKIVLSSSSRLAPALRLYESLGFRRLEVPSDLGYETADVYMELDLLDSSAGPASPKPMPEPRPTPSNIYPSLTYDDAPAAIEWLCRAFGFSKRLVVPGADRAVAHSELTLGPGVVMVSSPKPEAGRVGPRGLHGASQALCVQVDDPDAHFARAKAAGASIVQGLKDEEYGSRGYMARDPEGHLWYFGTYRPGRYWDGAETS